jgi:molybdenum cofactor cytidylyltransferase
LYPDLGILYPAGAMHSIKSIAPIILAAGDSKRMGYPKALLPIREATFLTRILGIVNETGLATPVIVLGRAAAIVQPTIKDWPARVQINADPDRGQLSSIQLGLSSLDEDAIACMIWPVDQPAVSARLVRDLAQLFLDSGCALAFPKFGDRRGHPAVFGRALFREFLEAPPEAGAKKIILRHLEDAVELPTDESAVIQDIDTPLDYESLVGESVEKALARGILNPES